MKNNYSLLKALLVAGIVGTMAHVSPLAHAATPLTTANKATLAQMAAANNTSGMVAAATALLAAAPTPADKQQLAQDIAQWAAQNAPTQARAFLTAFAPVTLSLGLNSNLVVASAIQGNPALASELATLMTGQGKNNGQGAAAIIIDNPTSTSPK